MKCTFFGHRDTPSWVEVPLRDIIEEMIMEYGNIEFYVGNEGGFEFFQESVDNW